MYVVTNMASAPKNTINSDSKCSIIVATYVYYTGQYNLKEAKMEYTIVVGTDLAELKKIVNDFLKYGWEPQGNLVIDPITKLYMQPVVRDLDDGTKEN